MRPFPFPGWGSRPGGSGTGGYRRCSHPEERCLPGILPAAASLPTADTSGASGPREERRQLDPHGSTRNTGVVFWVSVGGSLLPPPPAEVKRRSREEAEDSHSAAPVNSHTTLETPRPRELSRHASSAWRGRAG